MRKTDKKLDNQIRAILTELCDSHCEKIPGFQWLTHVVNYSNFPASLYVVCVFDNNSNMSAFIKKDNSEQINPSFITLLLNKQFNGLGIKLKSPDKLIRYDDEVSCLEEHNGNWANRLS